MQLILISGLSGSGKTTLSEALKTELDKKGIPSVLLDGDEMRQGISNDLGFSEEERGENVRRTAEIAKLVGKSGVNVICALISPFGKDRLSARNLLSNFHYVEVFVDTPLEICEKRDSKGYYKKARIKEIINFTGIDSLYERPDSPEIIINTDGTPTQESVETILTYLLR